MSPTEMKRTRTGARVPADGPALSYQGDLVDESAIIGQPDSPAGRMRIKILLTAIALFAERGYETCSMRTIASAVGLRAPTLYNYYPSKEALLVAAVDFGMDNFFSYVLKDIDQTDRSERLLEIARRHAGYKLRHQVISRANDRLIDPQFGKLFFAETDREHFRRRLDAYRYRIHDLVTDFVGVDDPVDPMFVTVAIMNQWDRAAYWFKPDGRRTIDETLQQILVLTFRLLNADLPKASAS
ncbi:TetR/AcrR family transcriptional regulator [Rhodopseudomonas palustris]|uniref:TetR/AcrR family transcriptional regulator n=1 Tax=Rhodopseudomonas palustris TaxID=1076 RepID=A0A418V138_RHOPL|nr:TetR/AcrR family transcriptional regulator [Rhodopseudomonas palustris]RJF69526.1 TetR/AcrR family transcriptional regulator [Rhodopseudomonas palustris]